MKGVNEAEFEQSGDASKIMKRVSKNDLDELRNSGLFDEKWYLEQYPDVKMLGMDPLEHYLWLGGKLGRNPSTSFDTSDYLLTNADVYAAGMNPLSHYVRWGCQEGRQISAVSKAPPPSRQRDTAPRLPVIVYDSHNLKLQGAPNSLFEIASGIKRRNKFSPILMANALGPLADAYRGAGIECIAHGISQNRLLDPDRRQDYINILAENYSITNASIIHVNTLQNFHCILAAHQAGIPSIWNIRESEDPETYYDYLPDDVRGLAYSCFDKAAAVVFVAEATRRRWQDRLDGLVENKAILNGVDISRLMRFVYNTNKPEVRHKLGVGPDDLLLLNVGTVAPRKGQLDLVYAIEQLDREAVQKIILAIAGFNESDYSKDVIYRLKNLEDEMGLRTIKVTESSEEDDRKYVAELYLASDLFILTSRVESYPRVTLEAMEFGLPIISTPCFGVCEQLVNGESAAFYDEGDSSALAYLIKLFLDNSDQRKKFGQAARSRLMHLNSYNQMLDAYEETYERILRARNNSLFMERV